MFKTKSSTRKKGLKLVALLGVSAGILSLGAIGLQAQAQTAADTGCMQWFNACGSSWINTCTWTDGCKPQPE